MAGKRILYVSLGVVFTGLAILGVWLPGLPTTPFVLLALWLFAQSSERMEAWLRSIPLLRHALGAAENYQKERNLPLSVKVFALSFAWGSTILVAVLTQSIGISVAVGLAAVAATVFMTLTPTRKPKAAAPSELENDAASKVEN